MGKSRSKKKWRIVLPEDPTSLEIGDVDRWLSEHDDRTVVERIAALLNYTTETDRTWLRKLCEK